MFADGIMLCMENPKEFTKKNMRIDKWDKQDTGSIYKNQLEFLYTSNEQSKNSIEKTIPLTTASERIK